MRSFDDVTTLPVNSPLGAPKKVLGVKWKIILIEMRPPTVPMMTVMTIFNDFEFDVPQQSTNNCQKLRERVLRHVMQLHFGTAGGKNDIKTNLKRFAVFIGFNLTHYIL